MTTPLNYSQPPLELADAVEDHLYGCAPAEGCGVCAALAQELAEAREGGRWSAAYDAAAEIRNHGRHATGPAGKKP
ncbi:hypothetical protein ACFYNY_08510 [Streptomyces sp. NPDC006530]|uniref:hypothetical protein n=1 Tax=Streptomyces sp. NPDC006530 TaxID=3364750 RepID=UPI00368044CC